MASPPPHHQSSDIQKMIAVIKQYPLGTILSAKQSVPYATHLPVIYNEETGKLVAHIDKSNPQLETLINGNEVTLIFNGPDTYISPAIYSTSQLPTWNYIRVHITGKISLIHDPEAAKQTLVDMTQFLEGKDQKFVLKKDDPRMDRLIDYIQAFEIEPVHWEGKFKLSQDKNPTDYHLAKNELIKNSREEDNAFIERIYKNL